MSSEDQVSRALEGGPEERPRLGSIVSQHSTGSSEAADLSSNHNASHASPSNRHEAAVMHEARREGIDSPLLHRKHRSMPKKREKHKVQKLFPDLIDDVLLDTFSCALNREILVHGKMYVTDRHLCFYANILGWVTKLVITYRDIEHLTKEKTARLFPNAIGIETSSGKSYFFTSFIARDTAYRCLYVVRQNALQNNPLTGYELIDGTDKDWYRTASSWAIDREGGSDSDLQFIFNANASNNDDDDVTNTATPDSAANKDEDDRDFSKLPTPTAATSNMSSPAGHHDSTAQHKHPGKKHKKKQKKAKKHKKHRPSHGSTPASHGHEDLHDDSNHTSDASPDKEQFTNEEDNTDVSDDGEFDGITDHSGMNKHQQRKQYRLRQQQEQQRRRHERAVLSSQSTDSADTRLHHNTHASALPHHVRSVSQHHGPEDDAASLHSKGSTASSASSGDLDATDGVDSGPVPPPIEFDEQDGDLGLADVVIDADMDTVRNYIFTDSPLYREIHKLRKSSNISAGEWRMSDDEPGCEVRNITYTLATGQSFGPKTTPGQETQTTPIPPVSGKNWIVDSRVYTPKVPYGDNFLTYARIMLLRHSRTSTRLLVRGGVRYRKGRPWKLARNLIESNTTAGLTSYWKLVGDLCQEYASRDAQHAVRSGAGTDDAGETVLGDGGDGEEDGLIGDHAIGSALEGENAEDGVSAERALSPLTHQRVPSSTPATAAVSRRHSRTGSHVSRISYESGTSRATVVVGQAPGASRAGSRLSKEPASSTKSASMGATVANPTPESGAGDKAKEDALFAHHMFNSHKVKLFSLVMSTILVLALYSFYPRAPAALSSSPAAPQAFFSDFSHPTMEDVSASSLRDSLLMTTRALHEHTISTQQLAASLDRLASLLEQAERSAVFAKKPDGPRVALSDSADDEGGIVHAEGNDGGGGDGKQEKREEMRKRKEKDKQLQAQLQGQG